MRLRGSIEAELEWREPELQCTGMSRPDGRCLRLRFAGPLTDGELAIVFAAPELGMGVSARGVPVNVTLLDGAGERIYGTRGDDRCVFDEVEQRPLEGTDVPPLSFQVSARGFCTAPARALDQVIGGGVSSVAFGCALAALALALGVREYRRPSHDRMLDWLVATLPVAAYAQHATRDYYVSTLLPVASTGRARALSPRMSR